MVPLTEEHADRRVQTMCLLVMAFIAVGVAMALLKPVLVPFVLAVFFTYCLTPIIDLQVRQLRMPRSVAITCTAIVALLVMGLMGLFIGMSINSLAANFGQYEQQFNLMIEKMARSFPLDRLGITTDPDTGRLFTLPESTLKDFLSALLNEVTAIISNGAIVAIFTIFMLMGRRGTLAESSDLLLEIERSVKRYIILMVVISLATGAFVGIVLGILDVRFAGLFAFLAVILNFIPSVGSILATLLPIPVLLFSPELSLPSKVLAIAVPGAFQLIVGSFIQPRIQGSSLLLHPVAILLGLIFFGMIWGLVGAFLATPILAVIKIVLERIPATQPVAWTLEGRLDWLPRRNPSPQ